jgi:hypothetical protein
MIVHEGDIYCRLHDIIAVAENDEQIKDTFKDEEKEEEQPTAPPPRDNPQARRPAAKVGQARSRKEAKGRKG